MKIKLRYLKITEDDNFRKLMNCSDKKIMNDLLKYTSNNLTTQQLQKFISIKSFTKVFKGDVYECEFKFIFSSFGDLILEVVRFNKRDMYKEIDLSSRQQVIRNFEQQEIVDKADTIF